MAIETHYTLDADLQLEDGDGAITSSAAGAVGGSAKIVDLGEDVRIRGDVVIDISAIDHTNDDETYELIVQGSTSATFADTIVNLASLNTNAAGAGVGGADVEPASGRYVLGVSNLFNSTLYRYLRINAVVGGTTPSVTYKAWLAPSKK